MKQCKCLKLIKNKFSATWFALRSPKVEKFKDIKYDFHGAIAKINRKTGVAYRIMPLPQYGSYHIIITLDPINFAALSRINSTATGSSVSFGVRQKKTHCFGVFTSSSDGRIIPKRIWHVDLYGSRSGEYARDAAHRAIASVAWRTIRLSHRPERSFAMSWQGQVERMNWVGLLEKEIRWHLADDFHEINPEVIYPANEI